MCPRKIRNHQLCLGSSFPLPAFYGGLVGLKACPNFNPLKQYFLEKGYLRGSYFPLLKPYFVLKNLLLLIPYS